MNIERFAAFSVWFKTNRYVLVAEPAFETESSQIKLICIHCQEDPFTVYPAKNGGWNIGTFTRHLNTEKVQRCVRTRGSLKLQGRWIQLIM